MRVRQRAQSLQTSGTFHERRGQAQWTQRSVRSGASLSASISKRLALNKVRHPEGHRHHRGTEDEWVHTLFRDEVVRDDAEDEPAYQQRNACKVNLPAAVVSMLRTMRRRHLRFSCVGP